MIREKSYENYLGFLEKALTPARLQHSLGVMEVMQELSAIYSLDPEQAMTAGLLHDAAKDLPHEQQLELAKEAKLEFLDPCEKYPIYLHAPVGAYLAEKKLNVNDSLVLDAIAAHSFSAGMKNFNAPLSQCLRFADLLAPITIWNGINRFKSVVYAGKAEEASLLQCGWLMEFFQEKQTPIHPNVIKQHQTLSKKLGIAEGFFERW
ncbi:MAG: bis(5'-nucleosyl)-tetraphosphatase (symmetrical) YqeK [Anaerolineales bacterium]